MKTKCCSKCRVEKPVVEFEPRPERKNGYYPSCYECKALQRKNRYARMKSESPLEHWIKRNFDNVKFRAKKIGVDFDLDQEHIYQLILSQGNCCEFCKIKFDMQATWKTRKKSPSIDRLVPHLGYIKKNVAIACYRCNTIKNNATFQELKMLSGELERLIKSRGLMEFVNPALV